MARRFTDTEKWRDEWYGALSNDNRIIWQYLLDNCTQAGIFKKDWRLLRFQCNTNISEEEFMEVFGDRVVDRGNYFFIPKFLKFQNKKGLNSNKPAVVAIREELIQHNLIQIIHQQLGNDFLIIKGMGIGKGEDKGKGKEGGAGEGVPRGTLDERLNDALNEIYIDKQRMTWRHIDFDMELFSFIEKVRSAPDHYRTHTSEGLRLAFQSQLRNAKPKQTHGKVFNKNDRTEFNQNELAIITAHASGGCGS